MHYLTFLFGVLFQFGGCFTQQGNEFPTERPLSEEEQEDIQRGVNNMAIIPAGIYQIGTNDVIMEGDNEGPKRLIELNSFYMDKYEVSNEDFSRFVAATNYKTSAESHGDSGVFQIFLNSTFKEKIKESRGLPNPWWYMVEGANWRHPYGPESNISGR